MFIAGLFLDFLHEYSDNFDSCLLCFTVFCSHSIFCWCCILSAVFTWSNLLVAVVELESSENEAADVIPLVTSAVLEEQYQIVGVVVIVDPGTVPINSRGEKQRMHLRDGFLSDQLDPIFVAYNMWYASQVVCYEWMWIHSVLLITHGVDCIHLQ